MAWKRGFQTKKKSKMNCYFGYDLEKKWMISEEKLDAYL